MNADEFKNYFLQIKKGKNDYIRLPESLGHRLDLPEPDDTFGIKSRYNAIKAFLSDYQPVSQAVDLGANCGYFSLSLINDKVLECSTLYEANPDTLKVGSNIAEFMKLGSKCTFIEQKITLDTLDNLPSADLVICLNLLHHAGALFDEQFVSKVGWDHYAELFLSILRKKYSIGVIGMGFKALKPVNWNVSKNERPDAFMKILKKTGWQVLFEDNVQNIINNGGNISLKTTANKCNFPEPLWLENNRIFNKIFGKVKSKLNKKASKAHKYHLYLVK